MNNLKDFLNADPFVPFRIVLTSGSAYEVLSPFQIAIGETQLNYYYPRSDRMAILRLNQIVSFETMEPAAS